MGIKDQIVLLKYFVDKIINVFKEIIGYISNLITALHSTNALQCKICGLKLYVQIMLEFINFFLPIKNKFSRFGE